MASEQSKAALGSGKKWEISFVIRDENSIHSYLQSAQRLSWRESGSQADVPAGTTEKWMQYQ